nr:glutathione hydrolase 1 proenzyme-like [Dermacentor andersoni]
MIVSVSSPRQRALCPQCVELIDGICAAPLLRPGTLSKSVTHKTWFIDGREESPSGASQSFYAATNTTETGQIRGLVKLHELTGNNLAWKKLFTEAIALAKDGFVVNQRFIDDLELYRNEIERNRELRLLFRPGQLEVGSMLKQSKMAQTLTKLASDARQDYFYQKEFATEWHRELSDIGSLIKLTDILNYEARKLPTLNITLEDELMLVTAPPPTTGAITAAICGIVKQKYSDHPPNDDASFYHVLTEAFKFGFGRRSVFGDYDFTDAENLADMMDPEYLKVLADRIRDNGVLPSYSEYYLHHDKAPPEQHYAIKSLSGGAVPIIIWAPNGDVVALITSLNSMLGSQIISEKYGIIYNNVMNDFDLSQQPNVWGFPGSLSSNILAPSRRPVTSLAPAFVFHKGALVAIAAGVGGGFAITGIAQVVLRNLMFSRSPKDAIDWYRIHHQLMPNTLFIEDRMDIGQQAYLRFRSHDVQSLPHWGGTVVAVTQKDGRIYATYDFRDNSLSDTIVGE